MQQLPEALAPLAAHRQFILWKLATRDGKPIKMPISPDTLRPFPKGSDWQNDPASTTDSETALSLASSGAVDGVGFLFTKDDPFFFVDLDKCLNADGATWSQVALDVLALLPGAAVEVSQSGRGLHIIGTGAAPDHSCKNIGLGLEFYTEGRFVALTGTNAIGSAAADLSANLPALVAGYFPPKASTKGQEWTSEPVPEWNGPNDDDELLQKALSTQSAGGVFGNRSTFAALWEGDEDVLAAAYVDDNRAFDASSADAALAQHLAFWTGNNCERIFRLMWRSGLVRDKWNREDYLIRTITRAASLQESFYSSGGANAEGERIAKENGAPDLVARSEPQRVYAEGIRSQKLAECADDPDAVARLCSGDGLIGTAKFWLDGKDKTPADLVASAAPVEEVPDPINTLDDGPQLVTGHQYLGATLQIEHFAGCIYIQDLHRAFTPSGTLLKAEQFNATYGGFVFQLDETGDKTTRKAWEAFTESQVVRYPKAEAMCFRPELKTGALVREEGRVLVNTYVPVETPRVSGDVTPFLTHLAKVLPDANDRGILLAYMAACVQHKGVKFQWAPLLQGTEGNGKTLFTRCVAFAVGNRYTHLPKASDIDNKFNAWISGKLFVGVEDIYVPEHKREVIEALKPLITNDRIEIQAKGADQTTGDNRANFMLNTNPKDAIRKTRNDRRFAVFYTAQQSAEDVIRDGMGGDYFPNLYRWLKNGGYAIVANYLAEYPIPDELNPATSCHRAPKTTSTDEAITAGLGGVEQEILEAIDEGRPGFAGGWISSMALERLLQNLRADRAIPHNKRRDLLKTLGYDWHPALKDGRVNNVVPFDGGKPRLFIRDGHISRNLTSPAEVTRVYQEAQGAPAGAVGGASEVFGG